MFKGPRCSWLFLLYWRNNTETCNLTDEQRKVKECNEFQLQNMIEGIIFPIRTDQTELESLKTPSISFTDSITQFSTGLGML